MSLCLPMVQLHPRLKSKTFRGLSGVHGSTKIISLHSHHTGSVKKSWFKEMISDSGIWAEEESNFFTLLQKRYVPTLSQVDGVFEADNGGL